MVPTLAVATTAVPEGAEIIAVDEPCWEEAGTVCQWVYRVSNKDEALARAVDFLLAKPLKIAFIVLLAVVATRLARRAIKRFVRSFEQPDVQRTLGTLRDKTPAALLTTGPVQMRSTQRAETIGAVLGSITTAVVWTIAVFTILAEFNINLGPLIAGAGIAGVALGFGAQSLVKDFLSGMFMLVEDQFGVGDIIDVGDASGVVEGVSLRTTRIRDVEGAVWHFPNGTIQRVANMSQQWSRALIDFEVAYETDLVLAKGVIKRVADQLWKDDVWGVNILEEPEVWGVEAFGPDGVAIRLVVKTSPSAQFKVMRELRQRMKAAFDAEGIEIPFPQRTVWVRPDGATLPGAEESNGHTPPDKDTEPAAGRPS
jgi:small-conductance mechanosensitive channel